MGFRDNLVLLTRPIAELDYEGFRSSSLAISPDGKYLATASHKNTARILVTGSQDGAVRVWAVPGGEELARLNSADNVNAVLFSLDGKYIVAASGFGIARVWSLQIDNLLEEACRRVDGNLSVEEWRQYLNDEPYRKTCPAQS